MAAALIAVCAAALTPVAQANFSVTNGAARPSAHEFARLFVALSNAYAVAHGDSARLGNADCVTPGGGRYMCSYTSTRPGRPAQCRLMQARWTPHSASTFTVTLAGRVPRCATLRDALRSLH
jgi:hypothetical protein